MTYIFQKCFLILTVFVSLLEAQINFLPHNAAITKVEKNTLSIENSPEFQIGAGGIVLHTFDATHQTIIASVEVIEKKGTQALLRYTPFSGLKQEALPSYRIAPKVGDRVILNYLYERAMVIAPNDKTLAYVTKNYPAFEWVHPDIFASYLTVEHSPVPDAKDFQEVCTQNSIGVLFFAVKEKGYFVDCNTLKTQHEIALPAELASDKKAIPFYSRIGEVKGRMFGLMGAKGINDYDRYYEQLLGVK